MSAEVRLLQEEQSVLVRSEGAVSIADFQAVRAHVAEVLRERRWRRVLFDGREVERPVTLIEAYGLTASLSGAFPSGTRSVSVGDADSCIGIERNGNRFEVSGGVGTGNVRVIV